MGMIFGPVMTDDPGDIATCEAWLRVLDAEIGPLQLRHGGVDMPPAKLRLLRERRNQLRRWRGLRLEAANRAKHAARVARAHDVSADEAMRLLASLTGLAQRYLGQLYQRDTAFPLRPYDRALLKEAHAFLDARYGTDDWPRWHAPREDR